MRTAANMRPTHLISMAFMILAAAPALAGSAGPDVGPGLEALRSGRFDEAGARFVQLSLQEPGAPEGPFYEAFQTWWRLIDRSADAALRLAMEQRLAESARRARAMESSDDADLRQRGLVFLGVSLLIDAQSKAARGAHFSAAGQARQGHRALSRAVAERPADADALFAMGTYNYYADHLPAFVKGLRFLLLIPGGDSAAGIHQLERAGAESRLFGVESLVLLAHIFSGSYEEDYARALGYLDRAVSATSGSPMVSLARADLLYKMGRLAEAAEVSRLSLEKTTKADDYPSQLVRALAFRLAACRMKLRDPLAALRGMDETLAGNLPETEVEQKRWLTLWGEAAHDVGRIGELEPLMRRIGAPESVANQIRKKFGSTTGDPVAALRAEAFGLAAANRSRDAVDQFQAIATEAPGDPRIQYDLGRLLQQQGRLGEATPHLKAAVDLAKGSSSADLAGWALLRLGWQLEQEGKRTEAVQLYRRAADLKQFGFRAAALERLARQGAPPPEG